ncbi:MAG TPA: class C sortase, partial [Anaerostipes hadrus]|nr:class C sortase [Anaerostipes hadrus]
MKQKIIPILIVLTGFLLLFYPFISNYLFEKSAGSTVESYQEKAAGMDQAIIKKVMDEAK